MRQDDKTIGMVNFDQSPDDLVADMDFFLSFFLPPLPCPDERLIAPIILKVILGWSFPMISTRFNRMSGFQPNKSVIEFKIQRVERP